MEKTREKIVKELVNLLKETGNDFLELLEEAKKILIPVWKSVKSGLFKNTDEVRGAYKVQGISISRYTNKKFLDQADFPEESQEYDLVVLTTAELTGKKEGGTFAEIFAGAKRLGLEKVTTDLVVILRSQYLDQPKGEWLLAGMEPIADSDGYLYVLYVGRYGDGFLWLNTNCAYADYCWSGDDRWVFIFPRK